MLLKKNLGFSIQFYVFGFSRCKVQIIVYSKNVIRKNLNLIQHKQICMLITKLQCTITRSSDRTTNLRILFSRIILPLFVVISFKMMKLRKKSLVGYFGGTSDIFSLIFQQLKIVKVRPPLVPFHGITSSYSYF